MAKKSKTQKAKASAARSARKAQVRESESTAVEAKDVAEADAAVMEVSKKKLFNKTDKVEEAAAEKQEKGKIEKKVEKKRRFSFLKDVRIEMKRVTWPTKQDVIRWSVVVVAALLFFGLYVFVLDNAVITPVLVGISGLGA